GPAEYVGRRRADDAPAEPPHGRHYAEAAAPQPEPQEQPDQHEDEDSAGGAHTGGQSVAELLARLQAAPSGGGRRRRRED
ncbi:MAG: hypothetical protein WBC15_00750, partial [Mycobacterium sp.]